MKKYFKLFTLTLIGAISFTACNNELEDNNGNISGAEKEIKIVAGINGLSRTESADGSLTTTFVKNDEIGIFVYESDKAVYSNVKYIYNGTSWTSENAIKAKSGVQYKYYAYYPYNSEVTDAAKVSVTVKADQTGGYNKEDFLTAQNTEAAAGAENITLNFNHAFSMVQVGIKETATTDANATVTLENIIPTAEVNVITGAVAAATGEATSVMMKKSATKMEYRAIVPAQTIAANAKLMSITADGKTFAVSNSADVNYEKGKALQITVNNLNALPEGEAITIGGSITDWDKGKNPGEGEVEEIPYIKPIGDEITQIYGTTNQTTPEGWFKLLQSDKLTDVTFGVETDNDTEWGKCAWMKYNNTTGNSWYKAAIVYNSSKPIYVNESFIYKLSLKIKAENNNTGKVSSLMFTCKSKSTDTERAKVSFAISDKSETINNPTGATTVTKVPGAVQTWETYTIYIDFSRVSTTIGTVDGTIVDGKVKEFLDSNPEDYNGLDLRIYTKEAGAKIYISDVKIEQYNVTE